MYLVSIAKQHHSNIKMDHGGKTDLITMHVFLSISGPESLCLALGRTALWHSGVEVGYPLQVRRELCASNDLFVC